jgi:hypothetical protein
MRVRWARHRWLRRQSTEASVKTTDEQQTGIAPGKTEDALAKKSTGRPNRQGIRWMAKDLTPRAGGLRT